MKIKALFILAGHSKYNPWANSDWLNERDLVIQLANALNWKLQLVKDFKTYLIWIEDTSLEDKVQQVNNICKENGYNVNNSLLIEIHCNALKNNGLWDWTWIETLGFKGWDIFENASKNLLEETDKTTWLKNRGTKDWIWAYIIKNTIPTALIFETGFIDSKIDREVFKNDLFAFSTWIYNWLKKYLWFEEVKDDKIKEYRWYRVKYKETQPKTKPATTASYSNSTKTIYIYPLFLTLSPERQKSILEHEAAHWTFYQMPKEYQELWYSISWFTEPYKTILETMWYSKVDMNSYVQYTLNKFNDPKRAAREDFSEAIEAYTLNPNIEYWDIRDLKIKIVLLLTEKFWNKI